MKNAIKAHSFEDGTPAMIMSKTNDMVTRLSPPNIFVTVFFTVLETATGKLSYCNAGHPQAIIKRKNGMVELLTKSSSLIGAFAELHYRSGKAKLNKGDTLILYTDGITEARCNRGFYGEERLMRFIEELTPIPTKEIPQAILTDVNGCTGGKLSDDVALLAVSLEK